MAIVSLPHTLVAGTPENVNHVQANEEALRDQINNIEDANIGAAKLSAAALQDGTVTDAKIASPNNSVYRFLPGASFHVSIGAGTTVNTYLPGVAGAVQLSGFGVNGAAPFTVFYFDPTEFAVAGKTTRMSVEMYLAQNNVAGTSTFTTALYPITVGTGTSAGILYTPSAATGNAAGQVSPSANSGTRTVATAFDAPVAGLYMLAIGVTVATTPANSYTHIHGNLRVFHV